MSWDTANHPPCAHRILPVQTAAIFVERKLFCIFFAGNSRITGLSVAMQEKSGKTAADKKTAAAENRRQIGGRQKTAAAEKRRLLYSFVAVLEERRTKRHGRTAANRRPQTRPNVLLKCQDHNKTAKSAVKRRQNGGESAAVAAAVRRPPTHPVQNSCPFWNENCLVLACRSFLMKAD
jgi:hypothetical protein